MRSNLIRLSEAKSRPEMILVLFSTTTTSCHKPVALVLAMQSMPQLLRQSFRSSLQLTSTSSPVRAHFRPAFSVTRSTPRSFSACLQCQFRQHPGIYSAFNDREKFSADTERLIKEKEKELADLELAARDPVPIPGVEAGSSLDSVPPVTQTDETTAQPQAKENEKDQSASAEEDASSAGTRSGGLPSYLENRRSKWSKQFSTVMDNVQSNVFVAGQRLNDLTGYSSIEALKNDIQFHGMYHSTTARTPTRSALDTNSAQLSREPTSHRPIEGQASQRRVCRSNQPPLNLPTRGKRAPPTQARLVLNRPGTIYPPLPQRPHKRGRRGRNLASSISRRARSRGGSRATEQEHPLAIPRGASLV